MGEEENPFADLSVIPAEMPGDDSIVKPNPDLSPEPEPEKPLTAAERVKARFGAGARSGAGRAANEPSISDAAPRPSRKEKGRKPAPPKPREGQLVKPLTDMYTSVGLMLAPFDQACSVAFIDNAENCARAMEKLARENESVRRVINAMMSTSAWGGVIAAHLPILLMVMMHHGPKEIQDRVAPMAMMMNPVSMQRAAEAQAAQAEKDAA